jgi:Tol biopolymer transport system component
MRGKVLTVAVTVAVLMVPPGAQAAFPGENGKIAFTTGIYSQAKIETIEPDGSGRTELVSGSAPTWSADGAMIAFTTNGRIHTINADGSDNFEVPSFYSGGGASWSPDGQRIAFQFSSCGQGFCFSEIYTTTLDGSTTDVTGGADPAWSPDGNRIAYTQWQLYGTNFGIHLVNPNGSGITSVTGNDDLEPAWSPDGNEIAFVRYPPSGLQADAEIYSINSDGTGETRLTNNSVSDTQPAWSPDGTKIALVSEVGGNSDIYVMNADGTGLHNVTNSSAMEFAPDWQPLPAPPPATDEKNAAKFCKAEQERLGETEFRRRYAPNGNGSNAFGKCVSENARR